MRRFRDISIRVRILGTVLAVNIIVAAVVAVHLHQSFSRGLEVTSTASLERTARAWQEVSTHPEVSTDFASLAANGGQLLTRMSQDTGAQYGLLLVKPSNDSTALAALRAQPGAPAGWFQSPVYVGVASTDPTLAKKMMIGTPADKIPESGRTTGIENGACSKTCHNTVKGYGDFWTVNWSADANTRAYAVLPISDAEGEPVGVIYSMWDISSQANSDRASLMSSLSVMLIGLAASTVLISFLLNSLVFKRLDRMIAAMKTSSARLAGGDFDSTFVPDGTNDEIGTFEQFFSEFLDLMGSMLRAVTEQLRRP